MDTFSIFAFEKPRLTKITLLLEIISIAALLSYLVSVIFYWPEVPQKIPTHFNFWGQPDTWGDKGTLPVPLYLVILVYLIFTAGAWFPQIVNFPRRNKEDDPARRKQLVLSAIYWIKAELVVFTSYLGWRSMMVARGQAQGLGSYFTLALLLFVFGTIAIWLYRSRKL